MLYYSNSNIDSEEEFQKREETLAQVARFFKVDLEVDPYNNKDWFQAIKGLEGEPEGGSRCRKCFRFNLGRTAGKARELSMPFTTTLTISPHKNSKVLFEEGNDLGDFKEYNFKKKEGYKRSLELSRELNLYRQDWCGCTFSRRD